MANCTRQIEYRCSDDCIMSGCPGHTGILQYQSTADAYSFSMNGRILHFERGELEAMLAMLASLSRERADAIELPRPAPTEAEVEAAAVLDAVIREMDTDEKGKPYVYTKPSMVIWTDKWRGWVARLRMARAALGVG